MAKQKTIHEIKIDVMIQLNRITKIWCNMPRTTIKEKLNGTVFSILTMLDGDSMLPKFIVAPDPHKDDKQYDVKEKCNYYPVNYDKRVRGDISGNLHDIWMKFQLKKNNTTKKKKNNFYNNWGFIYLIGYLIGLISILLINNSVLSILSYGIFMFISFVIIDKYLR